MWLPPTWIEVLQDVSCNGTGPQTPCHTDSLHSQTGEGTSPVGMLRLNSAYFTKSSSCFRDAGRAGEIKRRERRGGLFPTHSYFSLASQKSYLVSSVGYILVGGNLFSFLH